MLKITNFKRKCGVTVLILVYTFVLYVTSGTCIILSLTGIRCLGCGMTNALISAIQLDFRQAFLHHSMFWSVPVLYICFLFDGVIFRNKWVNIVFYVLILIGFILNWMFHN